MALIEEQTEPAIVTETRQLGLIAEAQNDAVLQYDVPIGSAGGPPSAHAPTHLPSGTDPLTTAAAVELTDATNAEGNAESFARSNHEHAHGNRAGGSLHALATGALAGFMSAADKAAHDAHLLNTSNPHTVTLTQAAVAGAGLLDLTGVAGSTFVPRRTDVTSGAVVIAAQLERTGGNLAAGDGVGFDFGLNSDAGTMRDAFRIATEWSSAADGAETSEVVFTGRVLGLFTEALRFRNQGLATQIAAPLGLLISPDGDTGDGLLLRTIANDTYLLPNVSTREFYLGNTTADPSVDLNRGNSRAMSLVPLGTTITALGGGSGNWVNFGSTVTMDYLNSTVSGLIAASGTFQFRQNGNNVGAGNLFKHSALFTNENGFTANLGSQYTFVHIGTYRSDGIAMSNLFHRVCLFQTTWSAIGGGTQALSTLNAGGYVNPILTAGVTVTNMRDWEFGAGNFSTAVITNRAHLYMPATNTPAATIFSGVQSLIAASANHRFIRHTGTAQSDFGGAIGLGAGATIDVVLSRGAANRLDLASGDDLRLVGGALQFAGTAETISRSAGELLLTAANVRTSGALEVDGNLNHDGANVGFYGVAPTPQSAAYTPTNVAADRAYDANATTINELADVLGTLIADLQLTGLIA